MKWFAKLFAKRPPCDHVWEACAGYPMHATRFVCGRCDADMIAPAKHGK